jgi:hypothetical protein
MKDGNKTFEFENKLKLTDKEKAKLVFHSFINMHNLILGFTVIFFFCVILLLDIIGKCQECLKPGESTTFNKSVDMILNVNKSIDTNFNAKLVVSQLHVVKDALDRDIRVCLIGILQ